MLCFIFEKKAFEAWYDFLTGLDQSHVQNFVDLRIVGRYVENAFWRVLDTRDVDWYQIFADLLPFHSPSTTGWHVEHLRPQSKTKLTTAETSKDYKTEINFKYMYLAMAIKDFCVSKVSGVKNAYTLNNNH